MVIRPFLAILLCLAGLTVNNGIGAPKMGKFSLQHSSGNIWRAQFAFWTKIKWKVKCFGPLWAPAPCKNKKKRPLSPKTSRWSCPGAAQMRFLGSNLTSTILIVHMDHLSAAGSSATRNLTTTEPSESLNRRKTVDFGFNGNMRPQDFFFQQTDARNGFQT